VPLLIATLIFLGFLYYVGYRTLIRRKPLFYIPCIVLSIAAFAWSFHYANQLPARPTKNGTRST